MLGKVVLTFVKEDWEMASALATTTINKAAGLIVARSGDYQSDIVYNQPFIYVDYEVGAKILRYIRSSRYTILYFIFFVIDHPSESHRVCKTDHLLMACGLFSSPTIKISTGKTLVGRPIATQVCGFSSRGPNGLSPAILKVLSLNSVSKSCLSFQFKDHLLMMEISLGL